MSKESGNSRTLGGRSGMVLPLVKLGTLAFRSISKPLANKLKKQAGLHPRFRDFIISIAQANHRLTTTVQRRIYGHATDVAIRPLNEERAVQAAAELLGETFLFLVAGAAIIFEVQRNAKKEELAKLQMEEDRKTQEELVKLVELHKRRHEELAIQVEPLKQSAELHKQQHEELAIQVELLKHKVAELERLANSQGFFGVFYLGKSQIECADIAKAA